MKRRIISMLLVVVMLALSLVSCGYSYAKDDMTQYTEFDKDGFLAGLGSIVIKDGEFTTSETVRAIKVLDSIYEALAKAVDADAKSTEGAIGEYDILYYVYYCTVTVGEGDAAKEYTVLADKMKESDAANLQLGLSDHTGLKKLIAEAVAGLELSDVADYIYKTKTTDKAAAGDKAYVSYTKKYTKVENAGTPDEVSTTVTETVRYDELTVGVSGGTTFADLLVGKDIGAKFQPPSGTEISENIGGTDYMVAYSDITIHWVVETGAELFTVKETTYTSKKEVAPTENYTENSGKIDLKDKELTYHVYPVYFKEVSELSATSVLDEIFGTKLTATSLPMFEGDAYKTLIEELAELFDERADLITAVTNAEKNVDTKQKAVDKAGGNATETQKTALQDAKDALEEAEGNLEDKEEEITTKITAILAVDTTSDGGEDLSTEESIVKEYKEKVYDSLESSYNNEVRMAVAEKIYNLIEEKVKVNSVPEKALDEAYDILYDEYKATFYTEDDSTSKKSYYSKYNGDFKAFLIAEFEKEGAKTFEDAKKLVRKEAEEAITPIVKIYAAAQGLELLYTDAEYKDEVKNQDLGIYEDTYGETNIRAARQIDKILDYYLEMDDDYVTREESEDDHGHDHANITEIRYKDKDGVLVLPYTRVTYTATEDGAVEE